MRVGRSALDEDAIRLLEEYHPDVEFDWTRILKSPPEAIPEPQQRPRTSRKADDPQRREHRVYAMPPDVSEAAPVPQQEPDDVELLDADPEPEAPREAPSAAVARLGSEGLLRLRARYAELMTRITQRIADAAQQEELKSRAERLNPDHWVTDEEVGQGLDAYEATFEELRAVIGRPRKRRRRRRGTRAEAPAATSGEPSGENTDAFDDGGEADPPDSVEDDEA